MGNSLLTTITIGCSGEIYSVQEGYMNVQKGYIMMNRTIMEIVARSEVASQTPD